MYQTQCAVCYGDRGQGRDQVSPPLVGGIGSLTFKEPQLTVGSYWPDATTVFDDTRRAMPYQTPCSLSADDTDAATAYMLFLNGMAPLMPMSTNGSGAATPEQLGGRSSSVGNREDGRIGTDADADGE